MTYVSAAAYNNQTYIYPRNSQISPDDAKRFLANYMVSAIYKKRLQSQGVPNSPPVQPVLNVPVSYNTNQDTQATIVKNGTETENSININKSQLANAKKDFNFPISVDQAKVHELSHISRNLSPSEQLLIASKNKSDLGYGLLSQYQADSFTGKYKGQYDDYQTDGTGTHNDAYHDYRPNENKADLDAFRYLMQKKGIYDTSKRDMNIDDFNKASKDPEIKNSLIFNRLIQQFNPDDIIKLNNTIAMNSPNNTQVSAASLA